MALKYESLEMEVIQFDTDDVITSSKDDVIIGGEDDDQSHFVISPLNSSIGKNIPQTAGGFRLSAVCCEISGCKGADL